MSKVAKEKMGITIKEIALKCGVSVGTVDRALNNRTGISPKTKQKILQVAQELNYKPNFLAHSLAKGKTMTLGIVLFDLKNYLFTQLLQAMENKAKEQGYYIQLVLTNKELQTEKEAILHLVNRQVDGIILFTVNKGREYIHFLEELHTPIVTIGNYLSSQWQHIGINEREAMKEAASFVFQQGYEQIIYICPPFANQLDSNMYTLEQRWLGLLDAHQDFQKEKKPLLLKANNYCQRLEQLLPLKEKSAIICISDLLALEVLNYLSAQSIHVPNDIGIMGFDNLHILKFITPQLTTVNYPAKEMGEHAVDAIIAAITGNDRNLKSLTHTIIKGQSL